ncbi:hypothetical protein QSH57_006977 [Fusarium oxysporum f. sp. vasinfectum]|nr:hypothetical protein QSH57_006977 [Fusarium oxysporum f. sp. vasinfectum]
MEKTDEPHGGRHDPDQSLVTMYLDRLKKNKVSDSVSQKLSQQPSGGEKGTVSSTELASERLQTADAHTQAQNTPLKKE